jgi:hypothetical protein
MKDANFNMIFKGRRSLDPNNKRFYNVLGTVEIGIGSVCLLLSIGEFRSFYLSLLFLGIISIVYAMIGKYWMAEKNYILIDSDSIVFKNLSQKPKAMSRDNIQDVMIESNKAVFITLDKQFNFYDFSIFKEKELKEINVELLKIKLEANKRQLKQKPATN